MHRGAEAMAEGLQAWAAAWLERAVAWSSEGAPLDYALVLSHGDVFLLGLRNTLLLVFISVTLGAFLAVPLALVRHHRPGWPGKAVGLYVYLFRGTPLLVQAYLIYYGLGQFELVRESPAWTVLRSAWWCAIIAFTLNTLAYQIEVFRGGLRAVPKGQLEAAAALGLSRRQAFRRVHFPLALRCSLPMFFNEAILMVHGSVVASTLTIIDILGAGRWLNGKYYLAYEGFVTASLLYMAVILAFTFAARRFERRVNRHLLLPA